MVIFSKNWNYFIRCKDSMADNFLLSTIWHSVGILKMDFERIFDVTSFVVVFTPSTVSYLFYLSAKKILIYIHNELTL